MNNYILTGTYALKMYVYPPIYTVRNSKDLDILSSEEPEVVREKESTLVEQVSSLFKDLGVNHSIENCDPTRVDDSVMNTMLKYCIPVLFKGFYLNIPSISALYTLKCSHLGWDIHWDKTKWDVLQLGHLCDFNLIDELYDVLVTYWKTVNGSKDHLNLSKPKSEFFDDFVETQYDHDYLHELVAYPNPPMYTNCLKDGEEVLISKAKFDILSHESKVRMFREEIAVIAAERWLLNPKSDLTILQAYNAALKKTIVSLTKNWATDFIICNLKDFVILDIHYFLHLMQTLQPDRMNKMTKTQEKLLSDLQAILGEGFQDSIESLDMLAVGLADDDLYEINAGWNSKACNWEHDYRQKLLDSGAYEHTVQEGGGEGGTEYCYGVFKLNDTLYKVEWSYYSYDGYYTAGAFRGLTEVKPKQKTITVYE
jgi:hypothetical protein